MGEEEGIRLHLILVLLEKGRAHLITGRAIGLGAGHTDRIIVGDK